MPRVFPADFPFFEVNAPARCALPDLAELFFDTSSSLVGSDNAQPLLKHDSSFPSLQGLRSLVELGHFRARPNPEAKQLNHWEVYRHLQMRFPEKNIPDKLCQIEKSGKHAESNSWQAALEFFALGPEPGWIPPTGRVATRPILRLDAIFCSVWLDRLGLEIPYVLDQLWVVSWSHLPSRTMLFAVEIDGAHKWDHSDGEGRANKEKNIARSFTILDEKVGLYRISSRKCAELADAKAQIQLLWDGLSTAAFLHRMEINSFLAQDASDAAKIFDLFRQAFDTSGYIT